MFRCLAVTGLCIGLIVQPLMSVIIVLNVNVTPKPINLSIVYYIGKVVGILSFVLCGVSISTSTAISLDRLLGLKLGLRHRHVVSLRRVRAGVNCLWLIAISFGFADSFWRHCTGFIAAIVSSLLCVVASTFSYAKIFFKPRNHQAQGHENSKKLQTHGGEIPLNKAQYKKRVFRIAWVQLAMVACYVPFIISAILLKINDGVV